MHLKKKKGGGVADIIRYTFPTTVHCVQYCALKKRDSAKLPPTEVVINVVIHLF